MTTSFPARLLFVVLTLAACLPGAAKADDASVTRDGETWTLDTAAVQKLVALDGGRFVLKSLKNKATGHEWVPAGAAGEEFVAEFGGQRISGSTGRWKLVNAKEARLPQGELELDISLRRDGLLVTKSYVLYPQSSVIREWATFANDGAAPLEVRDPRFLVLPASTGAAASRRFHWMTGGENQAGSWLLRTEALEAGKPRRFDSYDPFPTGGTGAPDPFPGDGVDARVELNGKRVWPAGEGKEWQYVANATTTVPVDFTAHVAAGDRLAFRVNMHGNIGYDTTAFDPTIAYAEGERESHTASKEFSGEQGKNGWRYQYVEAGNPTDLVYYAGPNQWRKKQDNPTGTPFVGANDQHPDAGQDSIRVWTAARAGKVRVTAAVCNTGNKSGGGSGLGFKPGTASYAPWYALYGDDSRDGLFVGFDYFGHWASSFDALPAAGGVSVELKVAGFKQTLAQGQSVSTPKAFVGLYRDDLDNAGNECLDWQYRYLWDYTREKEGWFPAIRMLGYWMKGTGWGKPGVGWTGGDPDLDSTFRKIFRVADLMRYTGADVYHRDWGWWDLAGDWNGPDFRTTGDYLRKSGMGQLIYAFLYTVDPQSKVAKAHPDWSLGGTLDLSRPDVVAFLGQQLDGFVKAWGNFEWRNDSFFTAPRNGDDTPLLAQDEGFRKVLRTFLDKYPGSAFQAVNGGGNYGGYDYTRYASSFSFSDGAVGILRNYHAALLLPPDKTSDIPDVWNPDQFDKATWRGLLCINFDMTGDTWNPVKLEGLRELIDLYHYLHHEGVVGRWVHVYRPAIEGDDPTIYFQRLSADGRRGVIIPKRPAPGAVTIRPKGLLADQSYVVSFQESAASEKRTGADLMAKGISLAKMPPGELIFLNLPLHPGSKLDVTPPGPPSQVRTQSADNMGYPGVELTWKPGSDDNWVSYYEIFRGGVAIDKVAKGTYFFDHSAGADARAAYAVRTVDGAGNVSAKADAPVPAGKTAAVLDDAPGGGITYAGNWRHVDHLQPAHDGTIAIAGEKGEKGATAEAAFDGKRVLLFSKLGAECGKASVSVDGGVPQTVDTYSADDIWGVCVYRHEFATAGRHTIRVAALGQKGPRSSDTIFHLDGIRAEGQ